MRTLAFTLSLKRMGSATSQRLLRSVEIVKVMIISTAWEHEPLISNSESEKHLDLEIFYACLKMHKTIGNLALELADLP